MITNKTSGKIPIHVVVGKTGKPVKELLNILKEHRLNYQKTVDGIVLSPTTMEKLISIVAVDVSPSFMGGRLNPIAGRTE